MKITKFCLMMFAAVAGLSGCEEPEETASVKLDMNTLELTQGETMRLRASVTPESLAEGLVWTTSDDAVAIVDTDGNVTGIEIGTATVTVTAVNGMKDECQVTVTEIPVESVTLDKETLEMYVGDEIVLQATILPEIVNDRPVTWTSSAPEIAGVDADGKVSALAKGEAVITAAVGEVEAVCQVTVLDAPVRVGDFYYSDGTTSAELDAGKTPIGMVFWVGDPTEDDATLKKDHPGCTHGLVISLTEVKDKLAWQENWKAEDVQVGAWVKENTDYLPITAGAGDNIELIRGYNNTKAIEAWNKTYPESAVIGVRDAVAYRSEVKAPEKSSGWYLPSAKELSLLCTGVVEGTILDINDVNYTTEQVQANERFLNGRLMTVEGAQEIDMWIYYWSSSACSSDDESAYQVYMWTGQVLETYKWFGYVTVANRFVLAF